MEQGSDDPRKRLGSAPVRSFIPPPMPALAAGTAKAPPRARAGVAPSRRRNLVAWGVLILVVTAIQFACMPGTVWVGDPNAWREESRSILHRGRLAVDPAITQDFGPANQPGQYFVQNLRNGFWYSKYGLTNSLMSLPPMLVESILASDTSHPLIQPNLAIVNAWNLVLSILLAMVLMGVTGHFVESVVTRVIFVLAVLYATFLWFYLRAQTSEIYQTLFYTSMFLCMLQSLRSINVSPLAASESSRWASIWIGIMWLFVAALVFTRVLYVLLLPLNVGWLVLAVMRLDATRRRAVIYRMWPVVLFPPVLIIALCAMMNQIKFGSPMLSGYHQWMPALHLPTGPVNEGLRGLLLRPRFSIFLYFPLLVLLPFCMRRFWREFPLPTVAALANLLVFLIALAKIPTWAGEWTFGPRYLLFALPVASLPVLLLIDWIRDRICARSGRGITAGVVLAIVLGYSSFLQWRAVSLDFFAFYYIRPPDYTPVIQEYFESRPVMVTLDDLQRHKLELESMPWFKELERSVPKQDAVAHRERIIAILNRRNFYWWGDSAGSPSR